MTTEVTTSILPATTQVVAQDRARTNGADTQHGAKVVVAAAERNPAKSESDAARESRESVAERMRDLADELNVSTASISRKLRFQFLEDANISVIQVYDRETEQLIRQIPSEEAVARIESAAQDFLQLIDTSA